MKIWTNLTIRVISHTSTSRGDKWSEVARQVRSNLSITLSLEPLLQLQLSPRSTVSTTAPSPQPTIIKPTVITIITWTPTWLSAKKPGRSPTPQTKKTRYSNHWSKRHRLEPFPRANSAPSSWRARRNRQVPRIATIIITTTLWWRVSLRW